MTAVTIGIAALLAGYLLAPLFGKAGRARRREGPVPHARVVEEALARELHELDLDRQTGKMTAEDYERAVAETRRRRA